VTTGAPTLTARVRGADLASRAPSRADRRLAARLRRRDPQALRDLHADLGASVFGFLRHDLGDRGAAEDVMQQVFLEVWQRGPAYRFLDVEPDDGDPSHSARSILRGRT
jgi:DNA-directed RNA polymerase specialized sigma24 family protein